MIHPKRHAEVNLPIQRISATAPGEQSIPPRQIIEVAALLNDAARQLRTLLQDENLMPETPLEVQSALDSTARSLGVALGRLTAMVNQAPVTQVPGGPTRQQGQFLAFIREYVLRNEAGVAPRHVDFQRFFNLTPPSVNSMLIRLEQRKFIRRIPGQARAIEIICPPEWIPPLDRPFKF